MTRGGSVRDAEDSPTAAAVGTVRSRRCLRAVPRTLTFRLRTIRERQGASGPTLAERIAERTSDESSNVSMTTCSAAAAPVARPATAAKHSMSTLAPMHAARSPNAAWPYRLFNKFRTPASAIAIPAPKNQTLAPGVDERLNVVAMWRRPRATVMLAVSA